MKLLGITLGLCCWGSVCAQSLSQGVLASLDSIATQDVPAKAPGIATGVVHKGRVVYRRYAGFAQLSDSSLIGPQSRFNIASNGKQFTALAVLSLIEHGKLQLHDDVRRYLPELFPKVGARLTVGHLLQHRSGIRDVYALWALQGITWWKQTLSNTDALNLLRRQQDLNFEPGSQYLYSNSNYILLAEIVAKVSGESFVRYTQRMFRELGMPHTSFVDDFTQITGPIAQPYFNFGTWSNYDWVCNLYGDGNLFSTLEDLLAWEQLVQRPKGRWRKLIAQSQQVSTAPYGYGLELGQYKGRPYRFHEGATGAWKATVVRFGQEKMAIVTLANTGKAIPASQTRQMVDVLLGLGRTERFSTQPSQTGPLVTESELVGTYQTPDNFTFRFELNNGSLLLKRLGRNDIRLTRESDNVFHQSNDPAFKQEFGRNAQGEMQVTAYYTSHAPYTLTRANSRWEGFNYQLINGEFVNPETNTTLFIKHLEKDQYEVSLQKDGIKALLITPTKLLVNGYVVEWAGSSPQTLYLSNDRLKQVKFERKG